MESKIRILDVGMAHVILNSETAEQTVPSVMV